KTMATAITAFHSALRTLVRRNGSGCGPASGCFRLVLCSLMAASSAEPVRANARSERRFLSRPGRNPLAMLAHKRIICRRYFRFPETVMLARRALLAVAGVLSLMSVSAAEQTYPDLESQWRSTVRGDQWDPSKPPGLAQEAPLTP